MLASANRKLFTGHEYDPNTGLYYAKARYYDPDQGRFLTQDSYLGQPGVPPSLHRYLYVASNPTRYRDPTGHFFQECEGVDCMPSSDELEYQISSGDFRSPGATGGMIAERAAEAYERRREIREWEAATERSRTTLEDRSGREQIATDLPYLDRALTSREVRDAEWNGVVDGGIDKVVGLAELSGGALPMGMGMVTGPALGRFTERVLGEFRPAPETNARAEYLRERSRGAFHGATTAVELGSGMVAGPGTSLALQRVSGALRTADELVEVADLGRAMTSGARATRGPPVPSNAALRPGAVLEDAWAGSVGAARARPVVAEAPVPASRTILGNEVGAPVVRRGPPGPSGGASERGVAFFDDAIKQAVDTPGATLGRPGGPMFFMPLDDAARLRTSAEIARQTGMAPGAARAYTTGGDMFGLSFPLKGQKVRVPTVADSGGFAHYFPGGRTAVRTSGGPTGGFLLNETRELVLPGGATMPKGSVLFKVGPNGEWIPLRKF